MENPWENISEDVSNLLSLIIQNRWEKKTREDTQQHALDVLSKEQKFQTEERKAGQLFTTGERKSAELFTSRTNAVENARRTKVGKWKNPLTGKTETLGTKLTGSSLKTAKRYGAYIQKVGDESWISLQENEILTQRITNEHNATQIDLAEADKLKKEQTKQVRNWYIQNKEMYPQIEEDADFMHWTYDDEGNRDKYVISKEGEDLLAGSDINLWKYVNQVAEATGMSPEDVTAVLADPDFIDPILDKWNRISASALGDLITFGEFEEEAAPYLEKEVPHMGAFRTLLGNYAGGTDYGLNIYGKPQSGDAKELYDIDKKKQKPDTRRGNLFGRWHKPDELMKSQKKAPKSKPQQKVQPKESEDVASPNPITYFPVDTFLDRQIYNPGLHDYSDIEWENIIEEIYQNM